jgi:hypothetical protein
MMRSGIMIKDRGRVATIFSGLIHALVLCCAIFCAFPFELRAEDGCDIYFDSVENWLIMGYTEYHPTVNGDYSLYLKVTDKNGAIIPAADIQGLTNNPELVATDAMGPNLGLCFDGGTDRTAYIIYSNASGMTLLSVPAIGPACSPLLSVSPLTIPFGTVTVGNTPTSPISVCNNGDCDLTIYSISQPSSPFSISSNTCGSTLPAGTVGNCCIVTVRFAPVSEGSYTSSVMISTNGGDSTVSLSGTGQNVVATYSISGKVTYFSSVLSGVTITLTGPVNKTATTSTSGTYSFTNLPSGSYTITPSKTGYRFTPVSRSVTISSSNITGQDFSASIVR